MALIQTTETQVIVKSINTDDFTPQQWRDFIIANLHPMTIRRIIDNGDRATALQRVKNKAIEAATMRFELENYLSMTK